MTSSRKLTDSRRRQGFRSQAHLDTFYAMHDHRTNCQVCSKVAGLVELADGSPQPFNGSCDEVKKLEAAFWAASEAPDEDADFWKNHVRYDGQVYSRIELAEAFDLVKNKAHWKAQIDTLIPKSMATVVRAAVLFFTATEANLSRTGQEDVYKGRVEEMFRCEADGYWAGPAN